MISSAFVYTRGAGHDIEYLVELCPALTVSGQIGVINVNDEEVDNSSDDRITSSV